MLNVIFWNGEKVANAFSAANIHGVALPHGSFEQLCVLERVTGDSWSSEIRVSDEVQLKDFITAFENEADVTIKYQVTNKIEPKKTLGQWSESDVNEY